MDHIEDDVFLPTIPLSEPFLPAVPPSLPISRKRPFLRSREPSSVEDQLAYAINTSSDPALFSNDETPDAENYSPGVKRRKKRTFQGTWWGDSLGKLRSTQRKSDDDTTKKRRFRRNFDSGIFMVDDSSSTDLSSDSLLDLELSRAREGEVSRHALQSEDLQSDATEMQYKPHRKFKFTTEAALKRMPQGQPINPKDQLVQKVVQNCLDSNIESVDFSNMGLESLPPAITDLKSMIKRINPGVMTSSLAPFEAELKVYLANNNFSQFPRHLLELENIQLLSVRQNMLNEVPPGVRSLVNLQELNVSSNNLRYLPWEVLLLSRYHNLTTIREALNPWMAVPKVQDWYHEAPIFSVYTARKVALHRYVVSKPIEILPDGSSQDVSKTVQRPGKVPHLSEMVLRALLRHNTSRASLASYLSEEHPQSARNLVNVLHETQLSGGQLCTFCNHDMVLPRYRWYEWWDVNRDQLPQRDIKATSMRLNPRLAKDHFDGEGYCDFTGLIDQDAGIEDAVLMRLTPFQRNACGCVDVEAGLANEYKRLQEDACSFNKRA